MTHLDRYARRIALCEIIIAAAKALQDDGEKHHAAGIIRSATEAADHERVMLSSTVASISGAILYLQQPDGDGKVGG